MESDNDSNFSEVCPQFSFLDNLGVSHVMDIVGANTPYVCEESFDLNSIIKKSSVPTEDEESLSGSEVSMEYYSLSNAKPVELKEKAVHFSGVQDCLERELQSMKTPSEGYIDSTTPEANSIQGTHHFSPDPVQRILTESEKNTAKWVTTISSNENTFEEESECSLATQQTQMECSDDSSSEDCSGVSYFEDLGIARVMDIVGASTLSYVCEESSDLNLMELECTVPIEQEELKNTKISSEVDKECWSQLDCLESGLWNSGTPSEKQIDSTTPETSAGLVPQNLARPSLGSTPVCCRHKLRNNSGTTTRPLSPSEDVRAKWVNQTLYGQRTSRTSPEASCSSDNFVDSGCDSESNNSPHIRHELETKYSGAVRTSEGLSNHFLKTEQMRYHFLITRGLNKTNAIKFAKVPPRDWPAIFRKSGNSLHDIDFGKVKRLEEAFRDYTDKDIPDSSTGQCHPKIVLNPENGLKHSLPDPANDSSLNQSSSQHCYLLADSPVDANNSCMELKTPITAEPSSEGYCYSSTHIRDSEECSYCAQLRNGFMTDKCFSDYPLRNKSGSPTPSDSYANVEEQFKNSFRVKCMEAVEYCEREDTETIRNPDVFHEHLNVCCTSAELVHSATSRIKLSETSMALQGQLCSHRCGHETVPVSIGLESTSCDKASINLPILDSRAAVDLEIEDFCEGVPLFEKAKLKMPVILEPQTPTRTMSMPWLADSEEEIKVGILHAQHPDTILTEGQMDLIQDSILSHIVKKCTENVKPSFNGIDRMKGWILLVCSNEMTLSWLRHHFQTTKPWEDADIKVVGENVLPGKIPLVGYFPAGTNEADEAILQLLEGQNQNLHIEEWKTVEKRVLSNGQLVITFFLPEHVVLSLPKDRRLNFKFGKISFKLKGKHYQ